MTQAVVQSDVSTFQGMIRVLEDYWSARGCIVQQSYDMEMGAGTFHPSTFLRAIGPEPWHACHVQSSRRPTDGRYGENPNRLQHFHQFQVAMKPSPQDMQGLYLGSLAALGFDPLEHDIRFVEDNWESPTLGAWGLGWEVWLNGMEVTQYTYFQQCGGLVCRPVLGELAYGLERLAMYVQDVESVFDLAWGRSAAGIVTYGDVFHQNEVEQSAYNFEHADTAALVREFEQSEADCARLCEAALPMPAYERVLAASHAFNLLDARHAISVTERQRYILRVRTLARQVAESWLARREALDFPLLATGGDGASGEAGEGGGRRTNGKAATGEAAGEGAANGSPVDAAGGDVRADLLIEIGCEDLPAGSIVPLAEHLGAELHGVLVEAGLASPDSVPTPFATPRRIAARWPDVAARQPDRDVERKGPSVAAAYDADGAPTKALQGFLRSAGASVDDLSTVETPKGKWVVLRRTEPGFTLAEVLSKALPAAVASMPMPRRMRWGDGETEFLRPLVWLLALHGQSTLPLELAGLVAGRTTLGHRFHAPDPIAIDDPAAYEAVLESAKVVADFGARRERVLAGVRGEVERIGRDDIGTATRSAKPPFEARLDPALVDEVTALVEWPVALAGTFDTEFLELPDEALIQTMEENQRYFAVKDADDNLVDVFVTVANIDSGDAATVVDGNERVIRPRFADTMFFWRQDEKRSLADFRPELERVLFQKKLGSIGDKVDRLEALVAAIGPALGLDEAGVREAVLAASLCKCDLVSAIVEELPKMQGIAGRHYARRDAMRAGGPDHGKHEGEEAHGYSLAVQSAMEAHYYPKQAGGDLPSDGPSNGVVDTLAIADKLDTIVGIYGQGLVPSGAKDPFGLRRAAIGIVRILLRDRPSGGLSTPSDGTVVSSDAYDIDIAALVAASARTYADRLGEVDEKAIVAYVVERLRGLLIERGASPDAVDAVLAKGLSHPLDIVARLEAIERFRRGEAATALAAASKRIGNLLRKSAGAGKGERQGAGNGAGESAAAEGAGAVDSEALVEPAERELADALDAVRPDIETRLAARDYVGAMTATATLREPVDTFFDAVMVMDEDPRLRANRLALLGQVDALCSATAELSRLSPDARPTEGQAPDGGASDGRAPDAAAPDARP